MERRQDKLEVAGFCPAHMEMITDIATIKESLLNIEKGMSFRQSIYVSIIILAISMFVQIVVFANLYGQLSNQVKVNTERWNRYLEANDMGL